MKKYFSFLEVYFLTLIAVVVLSGATFVRAQTPTPTATPAATDVQKVQPEAIKGVPDIAPRFQKDDPTLPDLGRVGVDMLDQRPLGMKEAITLALENNNDIEVTRQNVKIAEFDLQSLRGGYVPRFTGQSSYERAEIPNVSVFTTVPSTINGTFLNSASILGQLPRFGTSYNATVTSQRQTTDNPIAILSPQNNSIFSFSLIQPLVRGRQTDQLRRSIEIAKKNLSLTDTQFRQRSIDIITSVQRAYWDLVFALRNLQVQRDGVRDAKEQLAHNKRLVEEGQLAPIDIVAAETQVAQIEQGVYEALENVGRTENILKNLIANGKSDKVWNEALVPTDTVELDAPRTTLPEALDLALQNRPEVDLNNVQAEINKIDQQFFRDQTKPQIDFTASYSSTGVGGSLNPDFAAPFPLPCQTAPNSPACQQQQRQLANLTGNSWASALRQDNPTFRAGITFNLPLFGDKTAKANLGRSLVQGEQIATQRESIEQNIQVDVRNALQSLRTAEARLRTAAIARENTQKQYESEQRKLDAGQSDIYKVLERQTALLNARSGELRAQTELNKAIADLQRATGNSLKANNVEARLRR